MRTEIHGELIKLTGLSASHLFLTTLLMAFITLTSLLLLEPVLSSDTVSSSVKSIYVIIVLLFLMIQFGITRTHIQSKRSWCEIDRKSNRIKLNFGEKEIVNEIGEFDHILIQPVKIRRRKKLFCAVLVGDKASCYLHICRFSTNKLEKDIEHLAEWLKIRIEKTPSVLGILEFGKKYP